MTEVLSYYDRKAGVCQFPISELRINCRYLPIIEKLDLASILNSSEVMKINIAIYHQAVSGNTVLFSFLKSLKSSLLNIKFDILISITVTMFLILGIIKHHLHV